MSDSIPESTKQVTEGDKAIEPLDSATPLTAIPSNIIIQEYSLEEISASSALQCLNELFDQGKLSGTKVAILKSKYMELCDWLESTRKHEASLLTQSKEYAAELDHQHIELKNADNFPGNFKTEVAKMRLQLLHYNNDYQQIMERQYQLEYQIEISTEEKRMLNNEYARMPKAGEVEKKVKELHQACDEMKKEILQRQLEIKTLKEDLENSQRQVGKDTKEYEKLQEKFENLKIELVHMSTVPNQIAKEADKLARKRNEVLNELDDLDKEHQDLFTQLKNVQTKKCSLEDEKYDMDNYIDEQRSMHHEKDRAMSMLQRDFELAKDREAVQIGDRTILNINLRHMHWEKKYAHDVFSRKTREKDQDIRRLKKAEMQMKIVDETVNHSMSILEKIKGQIDSIPKDDGTLQNKREELQKDVEQTKRALANQNALTAVERAKLESNTEEEQHLLHEQNEHRIEVFELTRLAAIKGDEREQQTRDYMRAEMRYQKVVEDLKTKILQIHDYDKKYKEMQIRLHDFSKLYDVLKSERNKCVNLIQTRSQKASEMQEKIKILQNEIEILHTGIMQKDRQLQKQRLTHMNSTVLRDNLRIEVAKQLMIEEEKHEKHEQLKMDIGKLNTLIKMKEEHMTRLRNRYEMAITRRNERGIKLIERNEEVCTFYEKINKQDQMMRDGNVKLQAKDEEVRYLHVQMNEVKRTIAVLRAQIPGKVNLGQELATLKMQLQQCQNQMLELEKRLENPYDEEHVRYLQGKDSPLAHMHEKIEALETRMAEKEEQLLEKDLVYEQVSRLASRARKRVEAGKDDTLRLAKKANELQVKIQHITRKIMALVSEMSMNQANALRLQQVLIEKEHEIEQCYIHMEKGEPPSEEIERQWLRFLRSKERRAVENEQQRIDEEDEEQYQIAGGVTTTADPRPNAYIPDDDSNLPLPRPYGKHAPFKPTKPGATMRHTRKPLLRPIEI